MARLYSSQSKHDAKVSAEARTYDSNGYDVWADVSGWPQPEIINGYRPDVIAEKGRHTSVIEVETPDSVDSARDLAQQKAFREWADRSEYRHFRRVVTG